MSKKLPRVSITERNQQTAAILDADPRYRKGIENPFGLPSEGVRLKDKSRVCRWVNDDLKGGGNVIRQRDVGYDRVKPSEIEDAMQAESFAVDATGYIVRGERGKEVLMSIPIAVLNARQIAKTERNLKEMHDFDKTKANMLEAAAAKYGGEAADYLNDHVGPVGRVKDSYERIAVSPDEE